jgi:RNA polymerase sigma-70 factor (ECF subfamily)
MRRDYNRGYQRKVMPDSPIDFAALLARARDGDSAALDQLAREYEPKLRMVARVRLGAALRPYLDSMDLVQSVQRSLVAGLRGDKYDVSDPEKLLALALLMVRRKAARQWRHLKKQRRFDTPVGSDSLPDLFTALAANADDPARAAEVRDGMARLHERLSDAERRIIELRLHGHSTGEIAQQLGLSPVALRVRMTRLRQRLDEEGVGNEWL